MRLLKMIVEQYWLGMRSSRQYAGSVKHSPDQIWKRAALQHTSSRPVAMACSCASTTTGPIAGKITEGLKSQANGPHHWPSDDTYLTPAVLLANTGVMMTPASAPAQIQILIARHA